MKPVVWLASYPKSGNTWLRCLLQSCLGGGSAVDINALTVGQTLARDRAAFDEFIGIAASDLTGDEVLDWSGAALCAQAAGVEGTLFVKTHDARLRLPGGNWTIPAEPTRAAVYLVRDPRDVAPSLARHLDCSVDEAIAFMAEPRRLMGRSRSRLAAQLWQYWASWSRNAASWLEPAPFPIHLVRYEQLRAAPEETLTDILAALGMPHPAGTVRAAVAAAALDRLRGQEAAHGFQENPASAPFFGDGRTGGWRDVLSAGQVARIEAAHGAVMRELGYPA